MTAEIIQGNALALPLLNASVDLAVTSPPYFGLRSYQDNGEHYDGQLGDEPTPAEFVDALIAATREMVRVLKPSGSIWVNLGDKYTGGGMGGNGAKYTAAVGEGYQSDKRGKTYGLKPKSLIGVPWRYAIRCIDDLGLILRAEVIWSKPNGLPESVTDRVRRSHETWFHFVKQPRYFSAVDEIREPHTSGLHGVTRAARTDRRADEAVRFVNTHRGLPAQPGDATAFHPLGKLPGSVWTIPTQPLQVPAELGIDHFAAFPMEWPRRIIRGWSPVGVCVECGQGRRPVTSADRSAVDYALGATRAIERVAATSGAISGGTERSTLGHSVERTITGYACGCDQPTADTTPAVVLDPFGGTGTTALVAHALGRHGISVDLSADYCRLARWRTTDPAQIAKAAERPKPQPVPDGQLEMSL